jgi:peptide/nickel transport system permease protein
VTPAAPALPASLKPQAVSGEYAGRMAWRVIRGHPTGLIGLAGFGLLLLLVVLAPVIAPFDPTGMDARHLLQPPSAAHPFGTDDLGRDIFSRVLWGGRDSLRAALMALAVAAVGGTLLGLVSGYWGGWVDGVIMALVDVLLAFPSLLLALSIVATLGPSLSTVLVALGASAIPRVVRFVRGTVLATKNHEYITAARALGATSAGILFNHLLPNIASPLIIYCTLGLGSLILATAGLSFIGLGAQPPSPEWGAMLSEGREYLREAWWMSVFPGLAVFLAVLFVNLVGDGLRDMLDPRQRH